MKWVGNRNGELFSPVARQSKVHDDDDNNTNGYGGRVSLTLCGLVGLMQRPQNSHEIERKYLKPKLNLRQVTMVTGIYNYLDDLGGVARTRAGVFGLPPTTFFLT